MLNTRQHGLSRAPHGALVPDTMTVGKVGEGEGEEEGVELYDAPAFAQPQGKRRSVTSVGSVGMWGGDNTEAEDDSDEETFGFE